MGHSALNPNPSIRVRVDSLLHRRLRCWIPERDDAPSLYREWKMHAPAPNQPASAALSACLLPVCREQESGDRDVAGRMVANDVATGGCERLTAEGERTGARVALCEMDDG